MHNTKYTQAVDKLLAKQKFGSGNQAPNSKPGKAQDSSQLRQLSPQRNPASPERASVSEREREFEMNWDALK
jgi:hypothetical protein